MTSEYIPGIDSADDPWVQLWQKVWDEHGEDGELTNYRIYGMSQAYAFVQALESAGEDLTREGLVEAIEEGGTEWEGPQLAPFRYSADSHMGIAGVRLVELEGGVGEPGWRRPHRPASPPRVHTTDNFVDEMCETFSLIQAAPVVTAVVMPL